MIEKDLEKLAIEASNWGDARLAFWPTIEDCVDQCKMDSRKRNILKTHLLALVIGKNSVIPGNMFAATDLTRHKNLAVPHL